MSDNALIFNATPGIWQATLTNGSKDVAVAGANPMLIGCLQYDDLVDAAGTRRLLSAIGTAGVTLLLPWSGATVTIEFQVLKSSPLRSQSAATAMISRDVFARMAAALRDGRIIPIISEVATLPSLPAEGDTYLMTSGAALDPNTVKTFANGVWIVLSLQPGAYTANLATRALKMWDGAVWATATSSAITDPELIAIAALVSAADKIPYFTGSGTAGLLTRDTDGTLAANSDLHLATQKAVKTYVDAILAAQDAMVFKGVIDCSANPNYPAADRGHTYRVSVAGKIGGASGVNVEASDLLICLTDATAAGNQATVGSSWAVLQANLDGAVIGPASATNNHIPQFDGTSGKLLKDGKAAPTGDIVGTSDTQTLTNKTITDSVTPTAAAGDSTGALASTEFVQQGLFHNTDDIIILATGQSNVGREDATTWTPPANLTVWNWPQTVAGDGTAFAALDGTKVNSPYSFAARIAQTYPHRRVRLVRIAFASGYSGAIAQWKTGAATPDMFAICKAQVELALTALGRTTIDMLYWWQGESDVASPSGYVADFETVQARFLAETWFPRETPVAICGTMPEALGGTTGKNYMNLLLQKCAQEMPATRQYLDAGLTTAGMWVDSAHPSAAGCFAIGRAQANAMLGRAGQKPVKGIVRNDGLDQLFVPTAKLILGGDRSYAMNAIGVEPRFQVHGGSTAETTIAQYRWDTQIFGSPQHYLCRSNSLTYGQHAAVAADYAIGSFIVAASDGTRFLDATSLQSMVDGSVTTDVMRGRIQVRTNPGGTDTVAIGAFLSTAELVWGYTARMGIGASSNQFPKMAVHGLGTDAHIMVGRWAASVGGASISLFKSRGSTVGARGAVNSGDTLGSINFSGDDGTNATFHCSIQGAVDGSITAGSSAPGRMVFLTAPSGSITQAERLRIDNAGVVSHRANAQVIIDANSHLRLRTYTVGTLPSAVGAAQMIYVSDGTSDKRLAVSDNANWRWPDGAVVS